MNEKIFCWTETRSDSTKHYSSVTFAAFPFLLLHPWQAHSAIQLKHCTVRIQNYLHKMVHYPPFRGRPWKPTSPFQKHIFLHLHYALAVHPEVRANKTQVLVSKRAEIISHDGCPAHRSCWEHASLSITMQNDWFLQCFPDRAALHSKKYLQLQWRKIRPSHRQPLIRSNPKIFPNEPWSISWFERRYVMCNETICSEQRRAGTIHHLICFLARIQFNDRISILHAFITSSVPEIFDFSF